MDKASLFKRAGNFAGLNQTDCIVLDCTADFGNQTQAQVRAAAWYNDDGVKKVIGNGKGGKFVMAACTDGLELLHVRLVSGAVKVTPLTSGVDYAT